MEPIHARNSQSNCSQVFLYRFFVSRENTESVPTSVESDEEDEEDKDDFNGFKPFGYTCTPNASCNFCWSSSFNDNSLPAVNTHNICNVSKGIVIGRRPEFEEEEEKEKEEVVLLLIQGSSKSSNKDIREGD